MSNKNQKDIPTPIKIISILFIIISALLTFFYMIVLQGSFTSYPVTYAHLVINLIILFIIQITYLLSGIGLLKAKVWGRITAIIISFITIIASIALEIFIFSLNRSFGITVIQSLREEYLKIIGILIYIAVLLYLLFNSRVKEAFKRQQSDIK